MSGGSGTTFLSRFDFIWADISSDFLDGGGISLLLSYFYASSLGDGELVKFEVGGVFISLVVLDLLYGILINLSLGY